MGECVDVTIRIMKQVASLGLWLISEVRFDGVFTYKKYEGVCTEMFQPEAVTWGFRERTKSFFHIFSLDLKIKPDPINMISRSNMCLFDVRISYAMLKAFRKL